MNVETGNPSSRDVAKSGVIWLTGYSAAGKTSLGRIVTSLINRSGTSSIHLDGDDLRGILGNKWGYEPEERLELARVYLRLCSHIASHDVTVVISAVAMYEEMYAWFKENVPGAMLVYLDVPEEVRRRRDATTKGIYGPSNPTMERYRPPTTPDLILHNDDSAELHVLAEEVVARFDELGGVPADHGRSEFWDEFYSRGGGVLAPSPFAVHVQHLLDGHPRDIHLIEVGCGNGRDAAFFARAGLRVTAFDKSEKAIAFCREAHGGTIDFLASTFNTPGLSPSSADVIYSRFAVHAMTLEEELEFLVAAFAALRPDGRMFLEARSINDPLARQGEVLSPTERIAGHYRRFIVMDELVHRLESTGFRVESTIESTGLAPFGDEDPTVIRVVARKT